MSAHRTRGILRAAALLAVGASPLMAGAASAAEVPDLAEGKLGEAPKVDNDVTRPVTDLLDGKTLKLPVSLPQAQAALQTSDLPVEAPTAPEVEGERSLTNGVALPATPNAIAPPEIKLPNVQQPKLPDVPTALPDVAKPPVDAPEEG
ncbi:hypothetical protein [Saccharothrix variisporea]|uniref:Secreted protein n=1 Tax=Saccharothrix variisporea TaxID=543527 RepID=A0A495X5C4_9PSEU|nr:hypothetical protein [Saccharothrix variisporea]RKT68425.1 hypothetical protein DFJ66_1610 [Saccharothrix variisporea]